jgi:Ni,Fe-hydrogenase I large subunit
MVSAMSRLVVGPFNRVEGDLEIKLDVAGGAVTAAYVNSPLYRGFEQILPGKAPADALVYAPRICGICSVSQSLAAANALAMAQGLTPPDNGAHLQNLILAAENVADHLTHFYMFFMPDFAQSVYAGEPWQQAASRFRAMGGPAQREFIPARAAFLHIMGLVAGHWPHTLGLQPGGMARAIGRAQQARLTGIVLELRRFLETRLFGAPLESVAGLVSAAALAAWAEGDGPRDSDFGRFLAFSEALGLGAMGRGPDVFLSYGAYALNGVPAFARGVYSGGTVSPLDPSAITEDHASSWLVRAGGPREPSRGLTVPDADAADAYSWCKAPRLGGAVAETGALARQLVDDHPLLRDLAASGGGTVRARVVARLIEVARLIPLMERWIWEIRPGDPFCLHAAMPDEARGEGLIEAARGSLGHWLEIRKGRIFNYQIVAPTTWNFSPRDGAGQPGACEQALVGAAVREGETAPVAVQHIVRSFDPCMVCTVH